jgi:hypothetical protein
MRYQDSHRVCELPLEALDLFDDALESFDRVLWRLLTPITYVGVRGEFRLRLWRHPRWIERTIRQSDGALAQNRLQAIVKLLVDGDILWVYPAATRRH